MRYGKITERGIERIVIALCADYRRRDRALCGSSLCHRTEIEYRYLNYKIMTAAREIVGEALADAFIDEIGGEVGYAKSSLSCYSESVYKAKKSHIKYNVAKSLHLVD